MDLLQFTVNRFSNIFSFPNTLRLDDQFTAGAERKTNIKSMWQMAKEIFKAKGKQL
jgi:hypothetical protein